MVSANQQPYSNNIMSKGMNPSGEEVLVPVDVAVVHARIKGIAA